MHRDTAQASGYNVGSPHGVRTIASALAQGKEGRARALEGIAKDWSRFHERLFQEAEEAWHFHSGSQWGYRESFSGTWVDIARTAPDIVRLTVNKIRPYVFQAVSILRTGGTVFGAVASKSDRADSSAAEAADAFSEYIWRSHKLSGMAEDGALHALVGGSAFVHVQWDPSRGRPVVVEERLIREPEIDDEGTIVDEGEWEDIEEPEGDLLFERLTMRQVVADPAAYRDQTGSGLFIRQELPRATIKRMFSLTDANVPHTSGDSEDMTEIRRMGQTPDGATSEGRDSAIVWTFYAPSSKKYPRGLRIVFSEGKEIESGENPMYPEEDEPDEMWPRPQFPVLQLGFTPRPHSYYNAGAVYAVLDCQRALNGIASKSVQHVAKIGNAKVRVPKGRGQDWSDEVGQVIEVGRNESADKYGYVQPPPLSTENVVLWRQFDAEIQSGLGINAATAGQNLRSEDSGLKIQNLQKRDIGRLEPVKNRQDAVWGEIVLYALRLFRRYATTERKVVIAGEDNQLAVRSFDASQLGTIVDIMVFNDQSIPRDPTEKILWLAQFVQSGVLTLPPEQRQEMIAIMGLRDFKGFMKQEGHHRLKARRHALLILNGEQPQDLWEEDDHLQHMAEMSKLRCGEEWAAKAAQDEQIVALFDRVYGFHKSMMEQKMMAQQQGMQDPQAPAGMPANPQAAPDQMPAPALNPQGAM